MTSNPSDIGIGWNDSHPLVGTTMVLIPKLRMCYSPGIVQSVFTGSNGLEKVLLLFRNGLTEEYWRDHLTISIKPPETTDDQK